MTERSIILLFIKAPKSGTVKTRLAAAIGTDAAAELSRCFILDSEENLARAGEPLRILYHPPHERETVARLLPGRDLSPQEGADLGERMEQAFRQAFADGFTKVLLLGSDIPDLPCDIPREALAALAQNDLVLGPASDGGYYLIGATERGLERDLFRGIPWSTPQVLTLTLSAAERAGLKVHLLPEWRDVDTAQDLKALAERNRNTAFACSRTMAYLKKGGSL